MCESQKTMSFERWLKELIDCHGCYLRQVKWLGFVIGGAQLLYHGRSLNLDIESRHHGKYTQLCCWGDIGDRLTELDWTTMSMLETKLNCTIKMTRCTQSRYCICAVDKLDWAIKTMKEVYSIVLLHCGSQSFITWWEIRGRCTWSCCYIEIGDQDWLSFCNGS